MVQTVRRPSQVVLLPLASATAATQKTSVVYRVPIQLEWDKGKVVTETTTEYKEVTDDSDFAGFDTSAFPGLTTTTTTTSGGLPNFDFKNQGGATVANASSDSSSDDEDEDKFQEEALKAHNDYRQKHGVPPLKLDKKLSSYAEEWAKKLAREDTFEHRTNQELGENLYCSWSSNPKAKCPGDKPVDSWYSEIKKYNFGAEPTNLSSGHFTQVVWKNSKKLGIGKAKNKNGKTIVVANYEPAGNWIGQYTDNVPSPKE